MEYTDDQIQDYLTNRLSGREEKALSKAINEDPKLAEEVEFWREVIESTSPKQRKYQEFKAIAEEIVYHNEGKTRNNRSYINKVTLISVLLLGVIVIGISLYFRLSSKEQNIAPELNKTSGDTTKQILIDTTAIIEKKSRNGSKILIPETKPEKRPKIKKNKAPIIVQQTVTEPEQKLKLLAYAQENFRQYTRRGGTRSIKDSSSLTRYDLALNAFTKKLYAQSTDILSGPSDSLNFEELKLRADANFLAKDFVSAEGDLEAILNLERGAGSLRTRWNLALSLLAQSPNKDQELNQLLQFIINNNQGKFGKSAQEVQKLIVNN